MLLLSLHVSRDVNRPQDDDRIAFYTEPETSDMVTIVSNYKGSGEKVRYTYTMPRDRCAHYVRTLLHSLTDDEEPFEQLTLNSALFPSVLYNVEDLDCCTLRTIDDMVFMTFDVSVRLTTRRRGDE